MYSLVDNPVHLVKRVDMGVFVHIFKIYSLLLLQEQNSFFKFIYFWFHWVFTAVHGLSLIAVNRGYSPAAVCRLLVAVASLVVVHGLQAGRLR